MVLNVLFADRRGLSATLRRSATFRLQIRLIRRKNPTEKQQLRISISYCPNLVQLRRNKKYIDMIIKITEEQFKRLNKDLIFNFYKNLEEFEIKEDFYDLREANDEIIAKAFASLRYNDEIMFDKRECDKKTTSNLIRKMSLFDCNKTED
jgi:hypothetical protein